MIFQIITQVNTAKTRKNGKGRDTELFYMAATIKCSMRYETLDGKLIIAKSIMQTLLQGKKIDLMVAKLYLLHSFIEEK